MKKLELYIETSTWNFFFADDAPEKKDITIAFFDLVKKGVYDIYCSELVLAEIEDAPEPKKGQLLRLIKECSPKILEITQEARELAQDYIDKGIIPLKKTEDALHVGIATVAGVNALVTWNYRHLANLRKADLFHSVNLKNGYAHKMELVTPMEVIIDET